MLLVAFTSALLSLCLFITWCPVCDLHIKLTFLPIYIEHNNQCPRRCLVVARRAWQWHVQITLEYLPGRREKEHAVRYNARAVSKASNSSLLGSHDKERAINQVTLSQVRQNSHQDIRTACSWYSV